MLRMTEGALIAEEVPVVWFVLFEAVGEHYLMATA